jgi:hypothetical protein
MRGGQDTVADSWRIRDGGMEERNHGTKQQEVRIGNHQKEAETKGLLSETQAGDGGPPGPTRDGLTDGNIKGSGGTDRGATGRRRLPIHRPTGW